MEGGGLMVVLGLAREGAEEGLETIIVEEKGCAMRKGKRG